MSELAADFAPWTPAASGVPMAPEEDESEPVLEAESEEEDPDKWVDEFGRRWFRSEVYPGRWYLLDTDSGVLWWDEPG